MNSQVSDAFWKNTTPRESLTNRPTPFFTLLRSCVQPCKAPLPKVNLVGTPYKTTLPGGAASRRSDKEARRSDNSGSTYLDRGTDSRYPPDSAKRGSRNTRQSGRKSARETQDGHRTGPIQPCRVECEEGAWEVVDQSSSSVSMMQRRITAAQRR